MKQTILSWVLIAVSGVALVSEYSFGGEGPVLTQDLLVRVDGSRVSFPFVDRGDEPSVRLDAAFGVRIAGQSVDGWYEERSGELFFVESGGSDHLIGRLEETGEEGIWRVTLDPEVTWHPVAMPVSAEAVHLTLGMAGAREKLVVYRYELLVGPQPAKPRVAGDPMIHGQPCQDYLARADISSVGRRWWSLP